MRDAWQREAVRSSDIGREAQMNRVFGYIKGLHATHLLGLGARLGLFEALARHDGGAAPEAIAEELKFDPTYVRLWCEAACAFELLDYDPSGGYCLAPGMDAVLGDPSSPYYLGRFPDLHLLFARDYAHYPELFRTGGTYPFQAHDALFLRSLADATRVLPRMFLEAVLPRLPILRERLEAGARLLDVGCGGGWAIVELAERFPNVQCVGIDVEPTSIGLAQQLVEARGLGNRVQAQLIRDVDWPPDFEGDFDLVMSFAVLHEIRPELKNAVVARCVQALRPDGLFVLFDERYPSSPTELRDPVQVYAVMAQWFEMMWGNLIDTREEIHTLLTTHGLRILDETALSRFYVVTCAVGSGHHVVEEGDFPDGMGPQ